MTFKPPNYSQGLSREEFARALGQERDNPADPTHEQHVSLVRVDGTWHVFSNPESADAFYRIWAQVRDAEILAEVNVDTSTPDQVRAMWTPDEM